MTPKEISQMIEKEIGGDLSITNWHSCDLKKCLVRPKKRKLVFFDGIREVWIVLEEYPEKLEGFMIFFDEENNKYGLAEHSEPFGFAYNPHDTFLAAFEAM